MTVCEVLPIREDKRTTSGRADHTSAPIATGSDPSENERQTAFLSIVGLHAEHEGQREAIGPGLVCFRFGAQISTTCQL